MKVCLLPSPDIVYPTGEKRLEEACVKDERKTKKELIAEVEQLRQDLAEAEGRPSVDAALDELREVGEKLDELDVGIATRMRMEHWLNARIPRP